MSQSFRRKDSRLWVIATLCLIRNAMTARSLIPAAILQQKPMNRETLLTESTTEKRHDECKGNLLVATSLTALREWAGSRRSLCCSPTSIRLWDASGKGVFVASVGNRFVTMSVYIDVSRSSCAAICGCCAHNSRYVSTPDHRHVKIHAAWHFYARVED